MGGKICYLLFSNFNELKNKLIGCHFSMAMDYIGFAICSLRKIQLFFSLFLN